MVYGPSSISQPLNHNIPEPHCITMVLQRNVALPVSTETFHVLELADGNHLFPVFIPHLCGECVFAVEIKIELSMIHNNLCKVPFTCRLHGFLRCNQIIKITC